MRGGGNVNVCLVDDDSSEEGAEGMMTLCERRKCKLHTRGGGGKNGGKEKKGTENTHTE